MAFITVNYLSKSLYRTVPVNVILPVDKLSFATKEYSMTAGKKFKTLYLLHGLLGNYTDWVNGTRIQRWAEEKGIAVVMPSGDNSFYIDHPDLPFSKYGEFIGKELPEIMEFMFPLSPKKEDRFIAGLSMGGFGALRNGLVYSDTFSRIASLSGAVHILDGKEERFAGEHYIFGDYEKSRLTNMNPRVAMEELVKEGREKPEIYLACGLSDGLLEANRSYRDLLVSNGFKVTYEEEAGAHEWNFWDRQIEKVLAWLPLEEADAGINSGNVRADKQ